MYAEIFSKKGKNLIIINESFYDIDVKPFNKTSNQKEKKKFFKTDLRFLKEKYKIDELLLVTVDYGLFAHYTYGIETSKSGMTTILPQLINLKDNSIMYKNKSKSKVPVSGIWDTPPLFQELTDGIVSSTENAIAIEKMKY